MALRSQKISINFASGLDQKTDPKLTAKLTTADNVVLRKNGTIEKRTGYVSDGIWSSTVLGGDPSQNPIRAYPFHDGVVAVANTSSTIGYLYARAGNKYALQETYDPVLIKSRVFRAETSSITFAEVCVFGASDTQPGLALGASFARGNITATSQTWVSAYDLDSEVRNNPPSIATGIGNNLVNSIFGRTFSLSAYSLTAYVLSQAPSGDITLYGYHANESQTSSEIFPTITGSETVIPQWDFCVVGSNAFVITKMNASQNIKLSAINLVSGAVSSTTFSGSMTANIVGLATPATGTDRIHAFWMQNTASNTALRASYSVTLSAIQTPTTITIGNVAYGPGLIKQLAAVETTAASAAPQFFFTQSSTTQLQQITALNDAPTRPIVGCSLVSKPFMYRGVAHAVLQNSSTGQQSFLLARLAGSATALKPIARWSYGLASPNGSTSYAMLPYVAPGKTGDSWFVGTRRASFFTAANGSITANYSAEVSSIAFSNTQNIGYQRFIDSTFVTGGFLNEYDGKGITPAGFLSYPVIASVSTTTTGGSLGAAAGSYAVVICKEFTTQTGRTYRGTPSLPVTFTTSTTTSQATITFSDGPDFRGIESRFFQVRYAAFRTTNAGTIYYRDNSVFATSLTPAPNSIGPLAITMTISDASLAGNDVIYTQGGTLPNWTPDAPSVLCQHQDRIFCNDPGDPTILRYSKSIIPGEGVNFALQNTIFIPGDGDITGLASLDSSLVVFRERSIFVVSGAGPDDTGLNGGFSIGQPLFSDIGNVDSRSLARFRDGIVFKSPDKGFYLLTRDLQLQSIGAEVESYNSKTVVSAEVVGLTEGSGVAEECRFLCSDGTLLTYNYYNGQWTTATLSGCTDAISTGGRYVVVNTSSTAASARVFQQSLTTYLDTFSNTSTTYQMTVETGWIKAADVQGLQRIWRGALIGEAQGGGRISVEIGYDYETAYNETHTATMSSVTAANYTGGATAAAQFDFAVARQKCEAIRFRIKDYPTENGAVMKLTNISLECGVKGGIFRLPGTKGF